MILRDYQSEAIDAIWSEIIQNSAALCVMATGMGKTEVIIGLLQKSLIAKPTLRALILMDRIDLVKQTERRFKNALGPSLIGVWCGSLQRRELSAPLTIASVLSADVKRFKKIDLIIVDEVHLMDQKESAYTRVINELQNQNHKLKVVGFTATAFRSDGVIYGEGKMFSNICYQKTIQEGIALGVLCPPILKHTEHEFDTSQLRIRMGEYRAEDVDALVANTEKCTEQVEDALPKLHGRECIAWMCANIDHCNRVLNELVRLRENVTSVHSKQDRSTRDANLGAFMAGTFRHVVFVSILSTGFDHPPIDGIVLLRPTRSPVMYVQSVGRGLRPYKDKKNCLVLDYGNIVGQLGPLDNPKVKGKKQDGDVVLKICPQCKSYVSGGCITCPECEHEFPPREEPEAKLTKTHEENAQILSVPTPPPLPVTFISTDVYASMYEAKSGNVCVKITYGPPDVRRWATSEFFVTNSPWALSRLEARLQALGSPMIKLPIEREIRFDGHFQVTKVRDGKFDRVTRVERCHEIEDTSFDFGIDQEKLSPREEIGF